jgi:hypothetical protein
MEGGFWEVEVEAVLDTLVVGGAEVTGVKTGCGVTLALRTELQ